MASRVCFQYQSSGSCSYGQRCKYSHIGGGTGGSSSKFSAGGRRKFPKGRKNRTNPLQEFFARYPGFNYNPSRGSTNEFHRMCSYFGWEAYSDDRDDAWNDFRDALVQEFNKIYGTDENDLSSWQGLCGVLGIPVSASLEGCRKAVRRTYVNLVDLVDAEESGCDITLFESELALSEYTKEEGKIFPKENAYAGGLLKYLLRQITNPGVMKTRGGHRRR